MISSATVQSAIVLMNRRMNAERDVTTFVPGCSRLTGMDLHHPQGMNRAQAQMSRVSAYAQSSTVTGYTGIADGKKTGVRAAPPSASVSTGANGGAELLRAY